MSVQRELRLQFRYALPVWAAMLLTSWMPDNRISVRLRGMLLSPFFRKCGRNLTVGRDVTLLNTHQLEVGDHCYFAKGTWVNAMGGVELESEVITSPYVVIASSNHGFRDGSVRFGGAHVARITIGRGSWIASHAVITAGVSIGPGSLVGANAVVVNDVPANSVMGGVPAKRIRDRIDNPSDVVEKHQIDA